MYLRLNNFLSLKKKIKLYSPLLDLFLQNFIKKFLDRMKRHLKSNVEYNKSVYLAPFKFKNTQVCVNP